MPLADRITSETMTPQRTAERPQAGDLLRQWRQRRRLSQLDLAIQANVSSRHLSFVETGRSRPTSEMILHLAEHLEVPLRDRNALLLAGGYAPAYAERGLAEPELKAVRDALQRVLAGHQPYPAVLVNRWWELVEANAPIALFTRQVAARLLEPPVNVLRLSLHPDGMAPHIANLPEWRAHLLARLHRQAEATGDPRLFQLHEELAGYPGGESRWPRAADVVVPLRYLSNGQELSFLSITAIIGTPMDITVEELAIESFYPADEATAAALSQPGQPGQPGQQGQQGQQGQPGQPGQPADAR
jgi:transcriptional regulator with XRE-family HTH domain